MRLALLTNRLLNAYFSSEAAAYLAYAQHLVDSRGNPNPYHLKASLREESGRNSNDQRVAKNHGNKNKKDCR